MKKVALSLAGLLAIAAFAPEASALPVFARQTGMACNACHFQHFPILNAFGRSFKASAFSMIGAQGKVEGEELSIPDRLNFGVLTTAGIESMSGVVNNELNVPGTGGELSIFYGGRVAEGVGFLSELGATGGGAAMGSAKLPMLYEVGGVRAGVVLLATAGLGVSHSFEFLNTGVTSVHLATPMPGLMAQHFNAASAFQYVGIATGAVGASVVVTNPDMFLVNVGKYAIDAGNLAVGVPPVVVPITALVGTTANVNGNYARAAFIFDAAGFNMSVGVAAVAGTDATKLFKTQMQGFDFQMMGDVGSMSLLVTASMANAPVVAGGAPNLFNGGGAKARSATTINASLGVTPHMTVIVGARLAGQTGGVDATGAALTDKATQLGVTYGLAQNIELSLTNTRQSGTAWNSRVGANPMINPALAGVAPGQNATSLKMEALF